MANILLPLQIVDGKLKTTDKIVKSIDDFLSLLITTSQNDSVSARKFGFVFNNLRFEIFNENEGVVYDSSLEEDAGEELGPDIYEKKNIWFFKKSEYICSRTERGHYQV